MVQRRQSILVVALGLHDREGGIERLGRRIARALLELQGAGRVSTVTFVVLRDQNRPEELVGRDTEYYAGRGRKVVTLLHFLRGVLRHRPDIVVYGHILLVPLALLTRLILPATRHLLFAYGIEVWTKPTVFTRWIVYNLMDRIASISRVTSGRMALLYGLRQERFSYLPCAVDNPEPADEARVGGHRDQDARHHLLSVSRLDPRHAYKNIDKVIQALPQVLRSFPSTRYVVVGDGEWREELIRLTLSLGIQANVHFSGRVDDEELERLYEWADVFLLPSNREGFGIVYLEAWSHGCPVIGGDEGSAVEVIRHGVDGLCVRPDPARIAEAVCSLLGDEIGRQKMGVAGLARVQSEFSHPVFRRSLELILEQVSSVRHRRPS